MFDQKNKLTTRLDAAAAAAAARVNKREFLLFHCLCLLFLPLLLTFTLSLSFSVFFLSLLFSGCVSASAVTDGGGLLLPLHPYNHLLSLSSSSSSSPSLSYSLSSMPLIPRGGQISSNAGACQSPGSHVMALAGDVPAIWALASLP